MIRKLLAVLLAALLVAGSAAADPIASYADVQDLLLAAAYKVPPADVILSGTVHAVVPSYSFGDMYYLFVLVDPDDVSMWSTEDDNFFVVALNSEQDPLPFSPGDVITVEGQVISIYSSPVCPYIKPAKINGSADF